MTTLFDLIAALDDLDASAVLHVARPWSPTSTAVAVDDDEPPEGLAYLLEVDVAREVVAVWIAWRDNRRPTLDDMCQAIIYYAQHDAYQPVGES